MKFYFTHCLSQNTRHLESNFVFAHLSSPGLINIIEAQVNARFMYAEPSFPGVTDIEANETSTVLIIRLGAFNLQRT